MTVQPASPTEDTKTKKGLPGWILTIIAIVSIAALFSVDYIVREYQDATTNIVGAEVIEKYKSKGGRRTLPNYMLTIREEGSKETRNVSVGMSYWITCRPEDGDLYRDVPGEPGKCYNPVKEQEQKDRLERLKDIANIKIPEINEIDLSPYVTEDSGE